MWSGFFLHRPYLFHIGMGGGLGGKIVFMGCMFHSSSGCECVGIGDSAGDVVGMIAVGDCRVGLRGLHGGCSVCPSIVGEGQWGLVGVGVVGGIVGVVVGAVVIMLGVVGGGGFSLSRFGGVGVVNASACIGG